MFSLKDVAKLGRTKGASFANRNEPKQPRVGGRMEAMRRVRIENQEVEDEVYEWLLIPDESGFEISEAEWQEYRDIIEHRTIEDNFEHEMLKRSESSRKSQ